MINSFIALGLFVGPIVFVQLLLEYFVFDGVLLFALLIIETTSWSNLFVALISMTLATLTFILLAHRMLWPFISRPIYSLQSLGIAKRSKLLGSVGALLIIASLGGAIWLEKVVEKLIRF